MGSMELTSNLALVNLLPVFELSLLPRLYFQVDEFDFISLDRMENHAEVFGEIVGSSQWVND